MVTVKTSSVIRRRSLRDHEGRGSDGNLGNP
jgi:hypothetical protein